MNLENEQIDILLILKRIIKNRYLFLKVSAIVFVISCVLILPVPRYYNSSVTLAPEIGDIMANKDIMSIASSFGFNVGTKSGGDAIYPDLYPELMKSNDFIIKLINYKVTTSDKKNTTTYYEYLDKHQKSNPLLAPLGWIKSLFTSKKETKETKITPFWLTKNQTGIFDKIRNNIGCSIDVKTGLIIISVEDQDPLIAAAMANYAKVELQNFITEYRTNKARVDLEYYKKITAEAKQSYENARKLYASYSDANTELIQESVKSKVEDLENEMQLKFNAYSALNVQLQTAQAKVQENTPAFTIVKSATVPLRPAGPKRMAFVLIMLILSWCFTVSYTCKDLFINLITKK